MKCKKCGHILRNGANYCQHCGAKVGEDVTTEIVKPDNSSKRDKIIIGIIVIAITLFLISLTFMGKCALCGDWKIVSAYKVGPQVVKLCDDCYKETQAAIDAANQLTDWLRGN